MPAAAWKISKVEREEGENYAEHESDISAAPVTDDIVDSLVFQRPSYNKLYYVLFG